jgi:hypothetical protein
MSKSNLRNLNGLQLFKYPYITYTDSTYRNLLTKLKKSVIWQTSTKTNIHYSFTKINTDGFIRIFIPKNSSYGLKKGNYTMLYNPNTAHSVDQNEVFFFKKVNVVFNV